MLINLTNPKRKLVLVALKRQRKPLFLYQLTFDQIIQFNEIVLFHQKISKERENTNIKRKTSNNKTSLTIDNSIEQDYNIHQFLIYVY